MTDTDTVLEAIEAAIDRTQPHPLLGRSRREFSVRRGALFLGRVLQNLPDDLTVRDLREVLEDADGGI